MFRYLTTLGKHIELKHIQLGIGFLHTKSCIEDPSPAHT